MSAQDSHTFASKSSGSTGVITRPSKLPLFGRRSSEKHLPPAPTFQPPVCTAPVTSPLGGVRPSTAVKPYFAANYQPNANNDSQRRRHPSSQPGTPVRAGQPEGNQDYQQIHRSAQFTRPGGATGSSSSSSKRNELSGVIPQSTSFPGSRHVLQNPQQPKSSGSKSKTYRMENLSVEHLQYLERRLQQLLEVIPPGTAKAKSDSGRQSAHPGWMAISPQGHGLHQSQQAIHQYPMLASPFHYHPQTAPLLLFPAQQPTGPSPNATGGPAVFGELDPYCIFSSVTKSASSHYAGTAPSSLQEFNRDELYCLLHVVRNMLSMHQQNLSSNASKSSSLGLDPLAALKHRPFSWYLHRTAGTPSSPASSTVNLFLDDNESMNAEATDDSGIIGTDDGDDDGERRQKTSSESVSHPPLLPAGFRNFTRYLDSKFGPDSNQEQRSRRHHHHQRRHRRESIENSSHAEATTTAGSSASNRGRSATDVKPKISITPCASDTAFAIPNVESSHQANGNSPGSASSGREETELAQRLAATWCAPYWCPPPLLPNASWYQQVTGPPPIPPHPAPPPPPPPPPPSQVRYFAPPPPPPNTAAACWFRAAANHFATAAAIFAADNAAAASAMAAPHQIQLPPVPRPIAPGGVRPRRELPAPCPSEYYPPIAPVASTSSPLEPGLYSQGQCPPIAGDENEDDFFVVSDDENQQHRRRQCRLPAVEPLQRQLWGRGMDDVESPVSGSSGNQTTDDVEYGLDMLPQDPALILQDQVDFYAQIKDLLELDNNITLPLPAGWAVGVSSSGRRFYVSCPNGDTGGSGSNGGSRNRTRTTTWQHPVIAPRIPLGWERVEMRRGNCVYYRHLLIPHTQRHHPDLWFPTNLKNVEFEQQSWFFDLRKLQESVSNFDKGNSQLIESYVDTRDPSEEARFAELLKRYGVGELENLLKHLDCRFFRDLHRMVVAFEVARIRIVRELFVQHIHRTNASATEAVSSNSAPESANIPSQPA
ncbi:hypothetical protein Aperf_G00000090169 [Anoplocephala perfoliata]